MLNYLVFFIPQDSYEIKQTKKKGRGIFASIKIKSGTIIGTYSGKILSYEEIDPKDYEYLMYLNDEVGIVADKDKIGVHLLNHSCQPNCAMQISTGNTTFVAIKDVNPQEELTISYRYPSQDTCTDCNHKCFCESPNCLKTMHSPLVNKA